MPSRADCSLHELHWMPLESFLARDATEMVGLAAVGYLEFGSVFVKDCATNGIFGHDLSLDLKQELMFLVIMVSGKNERRMGCEPK